MRPEHDAVVLAGGRGRRLGGASKPDVVLAGRRLIDRTLEATTSARRVVVVGPDHVAPAWAVSTLEDPPGGGPVAALAAGLAALGRSDLPVLVLACDVPAAAAGVDALFAALTRDAAGAVARDGAGRMQPLVGVYRRAPLEAALAALAAGPGLRDAAVRRLTGSLTLVPVDDVDGYALDVDTWDDLARAEEALGAARGPEPPPPERAAPV